MTFLAIVHLFSLLYSIPLCDDTTTYSVIDLSYYQFGAIKNSAIMNIYIQICW